MKTFIHINGNNPHSSFGSILIKTIGFLSFLLIIALLATLIIPLAAIFVIGYLCLKIVHAFLSDDSVEDSPETDEIIVSQNNSAPEEATAIPCEIVEDTAKNK